MEKASNTNLCQDRWRYPASEDVASLPSFRPSPEEAALCHRRHPPGDIAELSLFHLQLGTTKIHF